ncbi:hypothetical protein [Candidatus Coxiella mudrowiae]|uniref:hypothetical protein n=1 Tax=Candidatus Coxiella mudrowiae TaxID=2054173 RepID=UPI001FD4A995|nr:hypothetical protein [Candidatus Coxiella mudrowiae]
MAFRTSLSIFIAFFNLFCCFIVVAILLAALMVLGTFLIQAPFVASLIGLPYVQKHDFYLF